MSEFDEGQIELDEEPIGDEMGPLPPHAIVLPEEHIVGDPHAEDRRARDAARAQEDALDSPGIGRRLHRAYEDVTSDPLDFLLGGGAGASANWLDELTGAAAALGQAGSVSGLPGSLDDLSTDPTETYGRVRDVVRDAEDEASDRSPYGYGAGEITGALATAPLGAEARAPTAIGRGLQAVRGGALFGGFASSGASEGEGDELLADTGEGVFGGGLAGGLLGAGGEALERVAPSASRAGSSIIDRLRELGDEAHVRAATGGGPLREEIVRAAPGGLRGEADRIRAMGLTGRARRPSEVHTAAEDYISRSGTTEASRAARDRGELPTASTSRDPDLILGFGNEGSSTESPFAEEFGDLASTASPDVRAEAERRLATARRAREFSPSSSPASGSALGNLLGAGGVGTLGLLADGVSAAADHVPQALGLGGTALALGAARRGLRGRGTALRATSLDAVRSLLERGGAGASALGRYAPVLRAAAERGPGALAAAHDVLSRQDPEYATTIEAATAPDLGRPVTPFDESLIQLDEPAAPEGR